MVELLHLSDLHIAKKFRRVNPLDFWTEFRAKRLMKLFRIERRLLGLQTTSDARPLAALVHFMPAGEIQQATMSRRSSLATCLPRVASAIYLKPIGFFFNTLHRQPSSASRIS